MKFIDNLHPVIKAALMGFLPAFVGWLLVVLVGNSDNEPSFNEATLTVWASRHLVFIDNRNLVMEMLGLFFATVIPVLYAIRYKGLSAGTGEYSGGHIYSIGWILFLVMSLAPFVGKNNNTGYMKIVDEPTFYYLKANPSEVDKMFAK